MVNLTRRQLLAVLVLTLQSSPEAGPVPEADASVVAMLLAKETILQELTEPGATTTLPELGRDTGFSDHTLRAALESLYADRMVDVEAVYWRPDWPGGVCSCCHRSPSRKLRWDYPCDS